MRELFAAILLLGMIALSVMNIFVIRALTDTVRDELIKSATKLSSGDFASAVSFAKSAKKLWDAKKLYLSCVLREDRIEDINSTLDEYIFSIENGDTDAMCLCSALVSKLKSICDSETLSLGSIF